MKKKARATASAQKRDTAETILVLIDSLEPAERRKLFYMVYRHPENEITKDQEARLFSVIRSSCELEEMLLEELRRAWREIRNRIPARRMSADRLETALRYQALLKLHGKQMPALRTLVNMPEEREKSYAKSYHRSKDEEALRQYIKQLMRLNAEHEKKVPLPMFFTNPESIDRLSEALKESERDTYRAEELINQICKNKWTTKDVAGLAFFRYLCGPV
jgi:hypothetical protein